MDKTIKIDGMTCISCENRIMRKLQSTKGITNVRVSYTYGTAAFSYDEKVIDKEEIFSIIEEMDYKVVRPMKKGEGKQKTDITKVLGVLIIVLAVYMLINTFGGFKIFNLFPQAQAGMGYGMLFVIGILTSLHCFAMCGGINLSQCAGQKNITQGNTKFANLRPSILYNLGRVISYTVIGGIVGAIGSFVSFSGAAKGIVQLVAGLFMVIMGINMLNLFPWLRRLNLHMPKIFTKKINDQKKKNKNSSFYVGLLNGLMPCGPLQAMQIYALSTSEPFRGALSMFLFSLGTVPLMFGLGALSSFLSKKFTHKMTTVSAVLVVILGIFMFTSGMSLSGIILPSFSSNSSSSKNIAAIKDGIQVVETTLSSGRYEPITVQKGIPVKWIIKAESNNINGCNNEIVIPKFNKEVKLKAGETIIEFTPTATGTYAYSCWMGMIRSKITVVDDLDNMDAKESETKSDYKIPTEEIEIAEIKDGVQYLEIGMNNKRFTPAILIMQSDIETIININASELNEDNQTLLFPFYNARITLREGSNELYLIPQTDLDFSTSDYKFFGYIKVVKDIKSIDVEAIKKEVSNFVPEKQEIIDYSGLPSCH